MKRLLRSITGEDSGQDLVEYTLLIAFVALSSAALFLNGGSTTNRIWSSANSTLSQAGTLVGGGPAQSGGGGGDHDWR
jgi:Flp pilus assembly pilin Flp